MKRLINKIKSRIRKWLGLGDMFIGVDVGIHDESCIIVVSRLKGGQVRIEDMRFGNIHELNNFVKEIQRRYGIPNNAVIWDVPMGMKVR